MSNLYSVQTLLENLEEIKKLKEFERFRNILKFFLIGFFIGKGNKKGIQELTSKTYNILSHLLDRKLLEKNQTTIAEKSNIYQNLTRIEEIIVAHKNDFGEFEYHSNLNKIIQERNRLANQTRQIIEQKREAIESHVEEILGSETYLISSKKKMNLDSIESIRLEIEQCSNTSILSLNYLNECERKLETTKQKILDFNTAFVETRKKDYNYLWSNGFFTLDDEQQTAIVTDDKHNLVVAAAGSGKTEVLITRIAYIAKRKPDSSSQKRILAIAYQRKARKEIENRLSERFELNKVNVSTFHKLGKNILEEARSKYSHTDIIDDNKKHRIIGKIFDIKIDNEPEFYKLFLNFIKTLTDEESESNDEKDTLEYIQGRAYVCIDGTKVNSRDEKEIMNFFLMHKLNNQKIRVEYETDVADFRPDFYLPIYDLYLEHWGLNKNGEVPDWFSQSTEEYKASMHLKKQWFAIHNKLLVETFSYEYDRKNPDSFIELLKKRITDALQNRYQIDFQFTLKSYDEIVNLAWDSYRTPVEELATFITTAKTYGLSPEKIKKRMKERNWTQKQLAFGNLILPVFEKYEEILQDNDKIDFEDMIILAIAELEKKPNLRRNCYDHILIDEYQDISAQRYKLIKTLMDRNPNCKLFCVGDDWQSIMSFSGSNINFFVNFSKYFEDPTITVISTNYRSQRTIVDAGANLIKNNTHSQIQKPTKAKKAQSKPIRLFYSPHKLSYRDNYHEQIAEDCVNKIVEYLNNGYTPDDILVLSRCLKTRTRRGYKYLPIIKTIKNLAEDHNLDVIHKNWHGTNSIRLLTAHGSKGLEAKVVFLLDVTDDTFGFPCKIEDSDIIELARIDYPPQDKIEEERRLFYVAMTRAIEELNIYTWEPAISKFLYEIEEHTTKIRLHY